MSVILAEADSILRRVAENGSLSVSKHLARLLVRFEFLGFALLVLLVLYRAVVLLASLGEYPDPS